MEARPIAAATPGYASTSGVVDAEEGESVLCRQIGSMMRPIVVYFVVVAVLVRCFGLTPRGSAPFQPLMPAPGVASEAFPASLEGALANAAVVVALAACFTYVFAALYWVWANRAMHAMTGASFAAPLARVGGALCVFSRRARTTAACSERRLCVASQVRRPLGLPRRRRPVRLAVGGGPRVERRRRLRLGRPLPRRARGAGRGGAHARRPLASRVAARAAGDVPSFLPSLP